MGVRIEGNEKFGLFKDELGVVRGLWFAEYASTQNQMRMRMVLAHARNEGEFIEEDDALALYAGHVEVLPTEGIGGYLVKFPSAPRAPVAADAARYDGSPRDSLVDDLLSSDRRTRETALLSARAMANKGDRKGLDALAKAIRVKAGDPRIELHEPGFALRSADEYARARTTLVTIARRRSICKEAKTVGQLMGMIDLQDGTAVRALLSALREAGGDDQVLEFQLVGTHLQAAAGYMNSVK